MYDNHNILVKNVCLFLTALYDKSSLKNWQHCIEVNNNNEKQKIVFKILKSIIDGPRRYRDAERYKQ